jgi:hypothetical protein
MPTPEPYSEFYAAQETVFFGNGDWEYKSPRLGIRISKTYIESIESWTYIAEIHTKDPDFFIHTGFAYHLDGGPKTRVLAEIAAEYNAVFALNIDYLYRRQQPQCRHHHPQRQGIPRQAAG